MSGARDPAASVRPSRLQRTGPGYATITLRDFASRESQQNAIAGLAELLGQVRGLPGLHHAYVLDTGPVSARRRRTSRTLDELDPLA